MFSATMPTSSTSAPCRLLLLSALISLCACAPQDMRPGPPELGEYVSRNDYLQLLEPRGDRILHGAGANPVDFADYWNEMSRTPPVLYGTHFDLMSLRPNWPFMVREVVDRHPEFIIPQIALSLTYDGRPYEVGVAKGELDTQLDILCQGLAAINRPVFLRIGYGFGAPATGYRPEPYRHAWIRTVETIRLRYGLRHVAMVWCYAADGGASDFMEYYPGDQYVDWWALDLFDPRTTTSRTTRAFLAAATEHGFPVMIGETAPRGVLIEPDSRIWERWFVPMLRFIRRNPGIKAFCYVNWDAGGTRLAGDLDLLQRYRFHLEDQVYQHAGPLDELRWQLEWEE
jgi:glycosyl hydrolase family 26